MKSTITESKEIATEYPALKISEQGRVVLFHKTGAGVCLHDPFSNRIGEYNNNWAESDCFRPFLGRVVIEA